MQDAFYAIIADKLISYAGIIRIRFIYTV